MSRRTKGAAPKSDAFRHAKILARTDLDAPVKFAVVDSQTPYPPPTVQPAPELPAAATTLSRKPKGVPFPPNSPLKLGGPVVQRQESSYEHGIQRTDNS